MILIADRIRAMGEMLARRFEADGLHARAVSDASDLLRVVAEGKATAVILDPMLPGNAGLGALIRIRALSAVPVLVLSTNDSPEGVEAATRAGSNDYAVKGRETPTQFVLRVRRLLGIEAATPYYVSVQAPVLRCEICRETLVPAQRSLDTREVA